MVNARHDPPARRVSEEEYLAFERASETKHELIDGRIVAMSGASHPAMMAGAGRRHNVIQMNIGSALHAQLRGHGCVVMGSDMRVQIDARHYFYPDVVLVCGQEKYLPGAEMDTLLNPTAVIEINSPSTKHYDRQYKLLRYMALESLQHILLCEQDMPAVNVYSRNISAEWVYSGAIGLESSVTLSAIGCTLALTDVYENVEFPPDEEMQEEG